jgi:hypothetical protein
LLFNLSLASEQSTQNIKWKKKVNTMGFQMRFWMEYLKENNMKENLECTSGTTSSKQLVENKASQMSDHMKKQSK